jgi:hypothetical protein
MFGKEVKNFLLSDYSLKGFVYADVMFIADLLL